MRTLFNKRNNRTVTRLLAFCMQKPPFRTRSLGDGQVDFGQIFSKMAQYNLPGWAVLE